MERDRATILSDALRVNPSEVTWHFIADFYDGPISGLVFFRGRIYRCCCFVEDVPEQHIFVLHDLTSEELKEELRQKTKFEALVGTHWSFDSDGKPLGNVLRSKESSERYFAEEKPGPRRDAWDRPVVAWFGANPPEANCA